MTQADLGGLDAATLARVIHWALAEDVGGGDVTSNAVIDADVHFSGIMAAREDMVVAGLEIAREIFHAVSPEITLTAIARDGDAAPAGDVLARLEGPARALLCAERTALNMLQHLSGIATLTRRYVDALAGTGAVLLDTRKTTPGLRMVEKYAARMGGAKNHRMGLDDAVLIKDNHLAVTRGVAEAVTRAKAAWRGEIEVECDTLGQVREALDAGADAILLDNMTLDELREAVAMIGDAARSEASGGVTLDTIRAIGQTGVQTISVGRITQSAPAVDIGLDWALNESA
ncbi:carboxylating nicotinate-nucleotide diphosphorylase [Varunaivibrio sulfuroxidans]|uniref:Probable nicotinate-nucleotide pyrophosphorylase [carboxylating] n=1 Tax=Varunaivibrio sulfuroxidans TaxID=1773489 RepID=A0A4R3JDW6_9PROT|nr:carboxylating nicotinate-nucleotide diphosphorylase [Varunaivibrio sulfuroxidans]TCS64042.1 nicotinate-nucleotide pyrophosphorylase [carboxylating] [Varunaivibrio sulfuroxidans]WES31507.1 carboxylating nicotinate-nucleotide diphosphorylase [Varunaivibrio sulfuroxidans]